VLLLFVLASFYTRPPRSEEVVVVVGVDAPVDPMITEEIVPVEVPGSSSVT
jgi:hypothetical protein